MDEPPATQASGCCTSPVMQAAAMASLMEVQQPWAGLQAAQAGLQDLEREICGGADLNFDLFLSRLQESGQRQCTSVWTRGTIAYRCRSCQVNESSAICVSCFQAGDHKDHDYVMYRSEAGGCCDCGDDASWKAEGFCEIHRRFVPDKVARLPVQVAAAASGAVRRVLKELIICVKEIYRMRTEDGALPLEIDISQTALLIRWSQKICSVEPLRDILCAEMMVNLPTEVACASLKKPLEILLSTFAKMPDPLMEGETTLFLQMLYNPEFKVSFSHEVLHHYSDMILPFVYAAPSAEAASGFKALDQSLDRVMVQLFNVPETTLAFIKHNGLLECFLSVLVSVMGHCCDRGVGTVNAEHKTISAKIYARPQGDLRLMLSHPAVALYVLLEREDIVKQLLSLLSQIQWMNPYTQNQDIDFEEQHSWKNAIQLEMGTMAIVFQLIGRCSALSQSNEETCRRALLQFARSTLQELLNILSKVKATRGPFNGLSLHIPLHRTLSAIVSKLVLMQWGEADQGFISELQANLSEAEVLSLMEHPLRILAWMSQVRVRQGHMNPESFGRLELIYRGSFWHDQSMDMDVLMLQFCCVIREHMEQSVFLALAEQFDLLSMVTHPAYVEGQPTKNLTTEKIAFLQEFMRLILLVVRDRHNTGMTENESLRYDVIQWLCARDTTFSQLYNCVNGFTTDHAKLSVMLQEVAVYIAPKLQERGCYQLKQECWVEFDPLFAQFYSNDLEDAQERAASIGKLEHFWRLPQPPQARPPFHRLINLLHTQACSQLIWNVLYHVTILVKEESTATAAEALGVTALQMLAMVLADARDGSSKPRKVSPSSGTRHAGAPSGSSLDHIYDNIYGLPFLNPDTGVLEWRRGESTAPTIHRMLLGLQKTKDSIRLVDSIMHVLSLLPSYDSRSDVTSISYPQMVDLSMEDERRKLKKQRQEAILKDFAARQKAFIEQQDGDQVLSKEVAVEQSVTELGHCASPVQAESSAADDAGSMLLFTDHSYHPRECAFCRCSCDGKDSGWIALVQRYNLGDVMVSRAELVQGIEEELLSRADSSLVAVAASFQGVPSKSTAIDAYPAEHVRCCGHQMHQTCFQRYVDSLVKRHNARCPYEGRGIIDLSRMEFLCPICRRLANVLLPDINASLAWNRVQQDHDDDEPSTSGGNTPQYGLDGGPDADISVVLYGEKDGAEEYWAEFWEANQNLAEVISVFASQCLRVRKNFRMEPPELKGFMLCRVLWEVLAANIVHAEVEMRSEVTRPSGQEASSSTSSEIRDGYLCRGDGAHWLALQQLGRLAVLANTFPAAAGEKDREVLKLQESFGMYSRSQQGTSEKGKGLVVEARPDSNNMSLFASAVPRNDSQSQSSSDDSEMLDERTDEGVPTANIEAVQDEVGWKCRNRLQFEHSTEEDWLWNFSTTISGGVLATDSFGLLIALLVAMRGCPSLVQLLALVHLAHLVCYTQGLLAIGALNRRRGDSPVWSVEDLNQTTCTPFLRRSALLVEVLTGKQMTGCEGYRDLDFVFLECWLRLRNPVKVQHITINGFQMETKRLQQTWQERLDSWELETFLLKIPRQISFVRLPEIFQDLMLQRLKTPCSNCNEVPGEPAICLACGKLFCYGRVKEGRGECYNHAAEGGCSSVGIFLLLHSTQLLLIRNERVCVAPSLYLDLHGEEDLDAGLKRGHLLHLSHLRLKEITRLWATASLDYDTHTLHTSQLRGRIC